MKYFFNIIFILFCVNLYSQTIVPDGINYQAVVRNNSTGAILSNTTVTVKFELFNSGTGTSADYTETVVLNTNIAGIITHTIGSVHTGGASIINLNWESADVWLKVSINLGGSFITMSPMQKFMTVPFSFFAKKAESANDVTSTYSANILSIGYNTYTLNSSPAHTPSTGIAISSIGVITNTAINTVSSGSNINVNPIATSTGTNYIVSTPSYSLSQTTGSITLFQGTTSINSVSVSPGGIYGGSGALTFSNTIASIGTNSLTFNSFRIPATSSTLSSITNFLNVGGADAFINISSNTYSKAGAKFLGNGTELYGSILGHQNGVTVSAGSTFTNALTTSTLGDVWLNSLPSVSSEGRMVIQHTSIFDTYPALNIKSTGTGANNKSRVKYTSTSFTNQYFETVSDIVSTDNNSAFTINYKNSLGYYNIFSVYGDRKVSVNALEYPLSGFHVMTNTATPQNGIISEGFNQPGEIHIARNNFPGGTGVRAPILANNELGELTFSGYNSTILAEGAIIKAISVQPFTSTSFGTDLIFSTVKKDSASAFPRMAIRNNGDVEIFNQLKIPTGAGSGKVLTSDGFGFANWQTLPGGVAPWTKTGTSISTTTLTDYVGIGTSSPTAPLEVTGSGFKTAIISNSGTGYDALQVYGGNGRGIWATSLASYPAIEATGGSAEIIKAYKGIGATGTVASFANPTFSNTADVVIIDNAGTGNSLFVRNSNNGQSLLSIGQTVLRANSTNTVALDVQNNSSTTILKVNQNGKIQLGTNGDNSKNVNHGTISYTLTTGITAMGMSTPQSFTVPYAPVGSRVYVTLKPNTNAITNRLFITTAYVSAANTIEIYIGTLNSTAVPSSLALSIDYLIIEP